MHGSVLHPKGVTEIPLVVQNTSDAREQGINCLFSFAFSLEYSTLP